MKTRNGTVLTIQKKAPPKKRVMKKRENDLEDEMENVKKICLEGNNVFERFEALLNSTNNLESPITLAHIIALQDARTVEEKIKKHHLNSKYLAYDSLASYNKSATFYDETPPFIEAEMRDYQITGLNWLLSLQKAGLNGILADEMGLGKTLQTIALIAHNKFVEKSPNPSLVIVPLTTLLNWESEVQRFCPTLKCFVLHGTMDERKEMCSKVFYKQEFDICCMSYETAMAMSGRLHRVHYNYVVIDEAQRIKNPNTRLSEFVRRLRSNRRLLLTGTPFNNNVQELGALLNYLAPAIFTDDEAFTNYFSDEAMSADMDLVNRLHKILNPFILRRVKSDVEKELLPKKEYKLYVGLSDLQKEWYERVLQKNIDIVVGVNQKKIARLSHLLMALREVSNHPYIFPGAEPSGPPFITDESIVTTSGKMILLDKMLKKFKAEGSRVLIFSQFTMMLDILEDYAIYRDFEYSRLDGQIIHEERFETVKEFNAPNSKKFMFLMSTRAGGLGINLATADIVIIYDSDFNPQWDFQAIDRAHRIGQKKQVRVFRLISEDTVDDYIIRTNEYKVRLGGTVIQDRDVNMLRVKSKKEMLEIILRSSHNVKTGSIDQLENIDLDELFAKSEKESMDESKKKFEELDANNRFLCSTSKEHEMYEYSGKNHWGLWPKDKEIELYDNRLRKKIRKLDIGERAITLAEFWDLFGIRFEDNTLINYRFYPEAYVELVKKKLMFMRANNQILIIEKDEKCPWLKKKDAKDLTEEQLEELEKLREEQACDWTYPRFLSFLKNLSAVNKNDYERIARLITCSEEEVEKYSEVFWKKHDELPTLMDQEVQENVKQYEARQAEIKRVTELLAVKIPMYADPFKNMTFNYSLVEWKKKYDTLPEEDRFIVAQINACGFQNRTVFEGSFMKALKMREYRSYRHWPLQKMGLPAVRARFFYLMEVIEKEIETGLFIEPVPEVVVKTEIKVKREVPEDDEKEFVEIQDDDSPLEEKENDVSIEIL